jgi:multiple sugar transport system permease protein
MTEQTATIPIAAATAKPVTVRRPPRPNFEGIVAMTVLSAFAVYCLVPYFWLIVASTKDSTDLFGSFGLWFAPHFNLFTNLQQLMSNEQGVFPRWLLNTFLYAGVGAAVGTVLSAMAGYALAKYQFRGRNLIFSIVLGAILVPSTVLAVPLFLMFNSVGQTNTYWAVLLPSMVGPFGVFLSRIYATAAVPDEILEAARVDGANEFRAFTIALRMMVPALVTIFLFQFVAIWNNFFLPLIMLSDEKLFPITVGLDTWNVTASGSNKDFYNLIVTGALISTIPLVAGCVVLQRFWTGGLTAGSIKG